jgi:hypothetical protein
LRGLGSRCAAGARRFSLSLDSSAVVREDEDRSAKAIVLTAAGRAIVDRVEAGARQVREDMLAGLPDADIEAAIRVLRHICHAVPVSEEAGA